MNVASLDKYVYPAALYYWTNTSCKVSDQQQSGNYDNPSYNDWSAIISNCYSGSDNKHVTATTQSVALVTPINYGVAQFKINVKFGNGELVDNGANWPATGTPVGQISVSVPEDGMTLTGVLVGGQKNVGWDFAQLTSDNTEKTIYDNSHATTGVKAGTDATVYTLALQTKGKEAAATETEQANFALEFTNNTGEDFTGADGIVPAGGKFYLVGQLSTDDKHNYIFQQDYTTVANVTISSLKSAYNCIPDLRTPGLELGLSVDLKWQNGLVNNVTID